MGDRGEIACSGLISSQVLPRSSARSLCVPIVFLPVFVHSSADLFGLLVGCFFCGRCVA